MDVIQTLYRLLEPLTHVPVNIWLPLMFVTAPVLVFLGKPTTDWRVLAGRLLLAWALTYGFAILAIEAYVRHAWDAYYACQSQFPDGGVQQNEACWDVLPSGGAGGIIFKLLGWWPALGYVTIYELAWRIWHKNRMLKIKASYRRVSTFLMIIGWLAILALLTIYGIFFFLILSGA